MNKVTVIKTITIKDGFDSFVECEHRRECLDDKMCSFKDEWLVYFCQVGLQNRKEIARYSSEPTISAIWDNFANAH